MKFLSITIFTAFVSLAAPSAAVLAQDGANQVATTDAPVNQKRAKRLHRKLDKRMDKMDANQDGQIDLNEYLAHAEARFNRLDANSDGFVTSEERRAAHREMRDKVRERRKQLREQNKVAGNGDNDG